MTYSSPKKDEQREKRVLLNRIAALNHSNNALQNENMQLKKQLDEIDGLYQAKILKMKTDLFFILDQKEKQHQIELSGKNNTNSLILPNEFLEKNKFLHYMILYSLGNAPTKDFLNFCNLVYLIDQGTFSVIRDFLPLIPQRTLRTINYPEKVYFKNCLLEVENIPKILAYYYPDSSLENQVHLTLGGDAASIKTIIESGLPSMYNFMALPLEKNRKPVSLHICSTRNGTSSKEIVEKSEK